MPTIPADDLADIFNVDELLTSAATVGANTVYGIFDSAYVDVFETTGTRPALLCRSSDVTLYSIARGTSVVINGSTYIVRNLEPDGTGLTRLVLELQ